MANTIFEVSIAHDKARQLPACRPERVEEVLWDWACNYQDMDIGKIMLELEYLYKEYFAEQRRQQTCSGNK